MRPNRREQLWEDPRFGGRPKAPKPRGGGRTPCVARPTTASTSQGSRAPCGPPRGGAVPRTGGVTFRQTVTGRVPGGSRPTTRAGGSRGETLDEFRTRNKTMYAEMCRNVEQEKAARLAQARQQQQPTARRDCAPQQQQRPQRSGRDTLEEAMATRRMDPIAAATLRKRGHLPVASSTRVQESSRAKPCDEASQMTYATPCPAEAPRSSQMPPTRSGSQLPQRGRSGLRRPGFGLRPPQQRGAEGGSRSPCPQPCPEGPSRSSAPRREEDTSRCPRIVLQPGQIDPTATTVITIQEEEPDFASDLDLSDLSCPPTPERTPPRKKYPHPLAMWGSPPKPSTLPPPRSPTRNLLAIPCTTNPSFALVDECEVSTDESIDDDLVDFGEVCDEDFHRPIGRRGPPGPLDDLPEPRYKRYHTCEDVMRKVKKKQESAMKKYYKKKEQEPPDLPFSVLYNINLPPPMQPSTMDPQLWFDPLYVPSILQGQDLCDVQMPDDAPDENFDYIDEDLLGLESREQQEHLNIFMDRPLIPQRQRSPCPPRGAYSRELFDLVQM